MQQWYEIAEPDSVDSPALLVYPDRIKENIQRIKSMVDGQCGRLRPHVKTNKMIEVCRMMMEEGVEQFKCSTIAEAEMLALANAKDVLMAYQPVGPKLNRWVRLVQAYPNTTFSCVLDNPSALDQMGTYAAKEQLRLSVYFDIDLGMGRTGVSLTNLADLCDHLDHHPLLRLKGVHGYDGHISNPDVSIRKQEADESYRLLNKAATYLEERYGKVMDKVIGGSPSFTSHALRKDVVCSPGTFVFWDWGYRQRIAEQNFDYAAVLMTRVVAVISSTKICIDLGYKAVASDPPLPRVCFLDRDGIEVLFQSEEHMVLSVPDSQQYPIGTVLYAVPTHVCPTVNLYEQVYVVGKGAVKETWTVIARNRKLNI
ncbi:D-TA family PLP-dependent enzyme [Sphingobacterium yanglingense]|uniref:D-serine deaminase-like pyridoxal phosphate-dependent protein n=1 Tax=Sphingobacterium yanglingense TaxID=1437280 RepID=A0A4R6WMC8_9SPHI|nr:D-TA family PLP-dependent enzyme [Sphingobacterium yanglingense]TDQ79942.1 D-serine deaminase-like pyridoxal phosphate-dependent protein [Sphingobacterium yanglingense]